MVGIGSVTIVFVRLGPEIMKFVTNIGNKLKMKRFSLESIMISFGVLVLITALPAPGRGPWILLIGFVYHYLGIIIALSAQALGALLAFVGSRFVMHSCQNNVRLDNFKHASCSWCGCHQGKSNKWWLFIISCVDIVEEQPIRMITLLTLSPVPLTAMSYVLGARCHTLPWWKLLIGVTLGGVKVAIPTSLAANAEDLFSIMQQDVNENPAQLVATIGSSVVAVGISVCVSMAALRKLKQAQSDRDPCSTHEAALDDFVASVLPGPPADQVGTSKQSNDGGHDAVALGAESLRQSPKSAHPGPLKATCWQCFGLGV